MKLADRVVFRRITGSDFFNIYKGPGQEVGGGGQSYIDVDTSDVTIGHWEDFFSRIATIGGLRGGPAWEFPVRSLGLDRSQTLRIAQRRDASVSIRSQKLGTRASNRVFAWHPDFTDFPSPIRPPTSATDSSIASLIENLVIYVLRATDGQYWAAWIQKAAPDSTWYCPAELLRMFDEANGFIVLDPPVFFDEADLIWPFRSSVAATAGSVRPAFVESANIETLAALFEADKSKTQTQPRIRMQRVIARNQRAVRILKSLYGCCQITGDEFVFRKATGAPYLEAHHLIPIGEGGADLPHNLIIVSAHVHRMLHYADVSPIRTADIEQSCLTIQINDIPFTIRWHPDHAALVESMASRS